MQPNVPLHQALTDNELDLDVYFVEDDDSDAISEEEEEGPFTSVAAKELLLTLAEQNKHHALLQAEATKLLEKGGLPQETAEEVFKQALGFKRRSTAISEELYDQCHNEAEFHLIFCLGVREAKAFTELAKQFNLATVNRNYNKAISYHKLRKPKSPNRKPEEKQTDQGKEAVETSKTSCVLRNKRQISSQVRKISLKNEMLLIEWKK